MWEIQQGPFRELKGKGPHWLRLHLGTVTTEQQQLHLRASPITGTPTDHQEGCKVADIWKTKAK